MPASDALIGDLTSLGGQRFVPIERDDEQGASAREKKIDAIDLRRRDAQDYLVKRLVVDLLAARDLGGISSPRRPGDFSVGSRFSFPMQSVEALAAVGEDCLLIAKRQ